MNTPEISVIIPAYNVEKWIGRAVRSLLGQTFGSFEVILVDDGSTDKTLEVCHELAASDERVRVLHQENAGAAAARNAAMDVAVGTYLYFMDGDDWAEPEMLGDMHALAQAHNLDLVVCGFFIDTYYDEGAFLREERTCTDYVFDSRDHFRASAFALFDAQLLYAPWNKLYRRAYLEEQSIRFPETFWDDLPFNLEVVRDIERVGLIGKNYYHFLRARGEAENTRYRPDMYEKREEEDRWLCDLFDSWGLGKSPEVREFLARRYAERLLGCIENLTCQGCELTTREKHEACKAMITSPRAEEALAWARPKTKMLAVLFWTMRTANVGLVLSQSALISFVKHHNAHLFALLKANR